ncbi:MAG TPA: sigma-E factor negative regulatory protein [Ramlibacter sp.]|jgi:sigma-E factor negative regulatory protein RseA|uniref:sigma-E factor negative regulatory protein n=1 Tax=Ramlibacter sp. TaxID=1917967 RepID=UPI002D55504B|nr:sigma-E factor negative regulatory protein [Ramlibacter sp.]HZY20318.1 sigma-E factor negative regulatory protein [Ramlibacter sp.]
MNDKIDRNERMSALADGQLQGDDFARAVQEACADAAALDTWHAYHLIGDVLRSGEAAGGTPPREFLRKLSDRLAHEAAPTPVMVAAPARVPEQLVVRPAANDGSFRWKLVAGVASVAAVAAVGWSVLATGPGGAPAGQPQLAAAPQPAATMLAGAPAPVMIRDPKLDELLAAHRQLGSASALQMPAGFVRNATFETPAR